MELGQLGLHSTPLFKRKLKTLFTVELQKGYWHQRADERHHCYLISTQQVIA